jgi:carbamoyl-phosphate synthase large subunit
MRSTGEVLGMAKSASYAFYKAQAATKTPLPLEGTALITVADRDKEQILEAAKLFNDLGFKFLCTKGTRAFLAKNGLVSEEVTKFGHGRPDITDAIKNGNVQIVINTPSGKESKNDDSYIRKTAIKYKVPHITTAAAAIAAAKGITERKKGKEDLLSLQEYHKTIQE